MSIETKNNNKNFDFEFKSKMNKKKYSDNIKDTKRTNKKSHFREIAIRSTRREQQKRNDKTNFARNKEKAF